MVDHAMKTTRNFTKSRNDGDPSPAGTYVLALGARMVLRDKDNVRVSKFEGDEIELNAEQAQRLRAGKPGSTLVTQEQYDKALEERGELEEVAVANEATYPADEDGFQVSPDQTRNRRRPRTEMPSASDAPATREQREDLSDAPVGGTTVEPSTTTSTRAPRPAGVKK